MRVYRILVSLGSNSSSLAGDERILDFGTTHVRKIVFCEDFLCLLSLVRVILPFDVTLPAVSFLGKRGQLAFGMEGNGFWLCWSHLERREEGLRGA